MSRILITVAFLTAISLSSLAVAVNWDGEAGDGKWSSQENWSDDTKPADFETVSIDGALFTTITVDESVEVNLVITNSQPGNVITFTADCTLDGLSIDYERDNAERFPENTNLTIEIPASVTLTIDNDSASNIASVKGAGNVIKQGPGRLATSGPWTNFTGKVTIKQGLVGGTWWDYPNSYARLTNANLVVEDGGSFITRLKGQEMAASMTLSGMGRPTDAQWWNVQGGAVNNTDHFGGDTPELTLQTGPVTLADDTRITVSWVQHNYINMGNVEWRWNCPVNGPGKLHKWGLNLLVLNGAVTNEGGVICEMGPIEINGTVSGDVTVATPLDTVTGWYDGWWPPFNGQTNITGTGTIGGRLTMEDGSKLLPRWLEPCSTTGVPSPGLPTQFRTPRTLNTASATLKGCIYEVNINDATGTAGTNWNLLNVTNDLVLAATTETPLTVKLSSITGANAYGLADNFGNTQNYVWPIIRADAVTGFDQTAFVVDSTGFLNDTGTKNFSVKQIGDEIAIVFGTPLDGDANMDCKVNILDLIFVRNRLNQSIETGDNWQANVNGDDNINILDLIYVRNRLNTSCGDL